MTELTKQRLAKFRQNRFAWFSFVILAAAYLLSLTSPWLVNDKPLFLKYGGKFYCPALFHYPQSEFYGNYATEPDYKELAEYAKQNSVDVFAVFPPKYP